MNKDQRLNNRLKKAPLIRLLLSPLYATDKEGFLYKLNAGGVAKPLRPYVGIGREKRVYFKVKLDGKYVEFSQDDLKRNQHKAIARVL